ncbi:MAG: TRAM domain-containing protein [Haloarcula sp.]
MDSSAPLCLFTGCVEARDGEYVVTVPEQEVELGTLEPGDTYRIGMYPGANSSSPASSQSPVATSRDDGEVQTTQRQTVSQPSRNVTPAAETVASSTSTDHTSKQPPVTEGETLQLDIKDVGDQGDGLARVGPGYVVFVPETEIGQQPLVRIETVRENVAFAEVIEE